ncbi:type 1 fimbrial protein [Burkholderia multivorans]|uniref:fimbrial protein n=1 Tax=Burkholderia multivorans TaxID=87883 RepID=UPI001C2807A5|nr:fimbrial protein [Burkholderia multivorans]MBU9520047.1 type 1 fimbrial protein [Burkholderia multivorans]
MKTTLRSLVAVAAFASLAPSVSHAAEGQITFTGTVKAQTCQINGNNGGGKNFTVALPPVSITSLAQGGTTAGRTAFTISLTNCSPATGNVYTHFEPSDTINTASGNLINKEGTASNVEVGVLNNPDTSIIKLGSANENSKPVALENGAATLAYYAQYVAMGGPATAGTVKTSALYSIVYQ